VFAVSAGLAAVSFVLGEGRHSQPDVAGIYAASGACRGRFELEQSGQFVDSSGALDGELRLRNGVLSGTAHCANGIADLCLRRTAAKGLAPLPGCTEVHARFVAAVPPPGSVARPAKSPPGDGRLSENDAVRQVLPVEKDAAPLGIAVVAAR
jgi:hypothetical protein